ncbi:SDR family oxidoreductase [Janibacter terrae]|uniref:SDR family oxidoreductase n=1 Tax=Janibacter terrae TaxID=103817 RepID=UPI00082E6BBA|nr:SDR family oxidoreductase [Janibacter terrae]
MDAEGKAWQVGNALIQRPGTGEDIAYMALYLASDESSWVTGQNYSVDGGATGDGREARCQLTPCLPSVVATSSKSRLS